MGRSVSVIMCCKYNSSRTHPHLPPLYTLPSGNDTISTGMKVTDDRLTRHPARKSCHFGRADKTTCASSANQTHLSSNDTHKLFDWLHSSKHGINHALDPTFFYFFDPLAPPFNAFLHEFISDSARVICARIHSEIPKQRNFGSSIAQVQ